MGFFNYIMTVFGINLVVHFKEWAKDNKKLANSINNRIFLLRCRHDGIYPKHIVNEVKCVYSLFQEKHPYNRKICTMVNKLKRDILNLEIKIVNWRITRLVKSIVYHRSSLRNRVPDRLISDFAMRQEKFFQRTLNSVRSANVRKYHSLFSLADRPDVVTQPNWLVNLTNVELPWFVSKILSLGSKFSLPYELKDFPWLDLLSDIENYVRVQETLDTEGKNGLRATLCNVVLNFYNKFKSMVTPDPLNKYLLKLFQKTKRFLSVNPSLIVLNSDKGKKTVVMNDTDYDVKMRDLLSDSTTYSVLKSDPTIRIQTAANSLIENLRVDGYIADSESKIMKCYNAVSPKIYGLVKIHKINNPLRPVVSCCGSPVYNVSKYLCNLLSNVKHTFVYSIRNSRDLIDRLSHISIPDDYVLVSVDVESLFTNIPHELVEKILSDNWSDYADVIQIPQNVVKKIVSFIFDSSYCQYKERFYKQIRGSAMGNPASPILAEIIMNNLIKSVISKLNIYIYRLYGYMLMILLCPYLKTVLISL